MISLVMCLAMRWLAIEFGHTHQHLEAASEACKSTQKHSKADSEALGSRLGSTQKHSEANSEALGSIASESHHDHFAHVFGYMMACTCSRCHVWSVLGSKAMAHLLQALSALGSRLGSTRKHSEANSEALGSIASESHHDHFGFRV